MAEHRLVKVKAHPGAREDRVEARAPDSFEVWTRAEAERGQANAAVLSLLAAALGVERRRLRIVKGASSPAKIVQLYNRAS